MIISLKPKHFKDVDYMDTENCPLATAVREAVGIPDITIVEAVEYVLINGTVHPHKDYGYSQFNIDSFKANLFTLFGLKNKTIRKIKVEGL